MNVELVINNHPTMDCFNNESFPYNIVSNYKSYEGWLYNNYIGVFISKNFKNEDLAIMNYLIRPFDIPGLEVNELSRNFFYSLKEDTIDFIKNKLTQGYYVFIHLNEFFLPNREYYKKNDFTHDQLIVGYDDKLSSFKLLGYSNRGKQEVTMVEYDKFSYSFDYLKAYNNEQKKITFVKVNECKYKFNVQYLIAQLENYILSVNLSDRDLSYTIPDIFYTSNEIAFGIETYSVINKYYKNMHDNIDLRLPHKLLEHKKWLLEIVSFLIKELIIIDSSSYKGSMNEIVSLALLLKKLSIKYNIVTKNIVRKTTTDKIVEILDVMEKKERAILKQLIVELKNKESE
ncbi:hypothetical protein [Carnobacterium mobile]|uniref:hypothetical protein n=1 Tax=Carnobacterium mobile TaxID=2750 RepID=UPI000558756B|nr:hypothetical protein [Carnobacterium mobile]